MRNIRSKSDINNRVSIENRTNLLKDDKIVGEVLCLDTNLCGQ